MRLYASFVHRSSQCGQRRRRGVAVSIVAGDDERRWLRRIEGTCHRGAAIRPLPEHSLDSALVSGLARLSRTRQGVRPGHAHTHTHACAHTRTPVNYFLSKTNRTRDSCFQSRVMFVTVYETRSDGQTEVHLTSEY
jgi:hypothetical protein